VRAWLLALSLGLTFGAGLAVGQAKPRMWADVLLDVKGSLPRQARVHVNLNHWDPRAETGPHRHAGPTIIVVLEGELSEWVPSGPAALLVPGQAYWRPGDREHNVRNLTDRPARALAVHLDPR
jgi:quercetin dioxygenase-like cupin family protein